MKKLIISLTVALSMLMMVSSCRWIHETFYSVEGCAEWYAEELYDAAEDRDREDFIERMEQFEDWMEDLNKKDQKRALKALRKWAEKNEHKDDVISDYADEVLK